MVTNCLKVRINILIQSDTRTIHVLYIHLASSHSPFPPTMVIFNIAKININKLITNAIALSLSLYSKSVKLESCVTCNCLCTV